MVNRLAAENKDFLEYVKLVRQFYQTGEVGLDDWVVPQESELSPSESRSKDSNSILRKRTDHLLPYSFRAIAETTLAQPNEIVAAARIINSATKPVAKQSEIPDSPSNTHWAKVIPRTG